MALNSPIPLVVTIILVLFTNGLDARFSRGACDADNFCGNNGECVPGPDNYGRDTHWCRCNSGFGGRKCELTCDADCSSDQKCEFDGVTGQPRCVCKDCDKFNQTIATCPHGFGGPSCQLASWCYPDKCLNGGKCIGDVCVCPPGLTGKLCEADVDECQDEASINCFNGKCVNTFGSAECKCPEGLLPPECLMRASSIEMPYAEKMYWDHAREPGCLIHISNIHPEGSFMKCRNQGKCVTNLVTNMTSCECPPGYTGEICEIHVNECDANPCMNGATCRDTENGFRCLCMGGFEGDLCEINQDDCVGNKCAPGSICHDGNFRYTCECLNGTMGQYCDKIDPCQAVPDLCQNGGTCSPDPETGGFQCNCERGYRGEFCHLDVDECADSTVSRCYHDGKCVNTPGRWECECKRGYNGTLCEQLVNTCESEQVTCKNGGRCWVDGLDRAPVCQCQRGFVGEKCEFECPPGLGGVRCDLELSQPSCGLKIGRCLNGGKCIADHCQCSVSYTGNHCEVLRKDAKKNAVDENTCASNPCLNNATCVNVVDRVGYACICQEGFEGDICGRRKNYCATNPCFNGGSCKTDNAGFTCECPFEFFGKQCEAKKPFYCTQNTCLNGGVCLENGTKCECSYGFFGSKCEQKVNLEEFVTKDKLFLQICQDRNCSSRASDGNCDLDCNFAACDFDGGDCSGRQKPFAKCMYGNMCAHLFGDGVCNQACNNEECLFDGMDCMPKVPRCLKKTHCASKFADGHCDKECNSEECGFDGGDCNRNDNRTDFEILSNIRVIIRISPAKFQQEGGDILIGISNALRSIIRIQQDSEGPLVFEWNGEEKGDRIQMDVQRLEKQNILSNNIRLRRDAPQQGVMVWLEAEKYCKLPSNCLFSSAQSVVDYISAEIAKKEEALGVPIYEAMVAKPSRPGSVPSNWTSSHILLMVIIAFVLLGSTVAGVIVMNGDDKRSRKRRIISAPVWMPPTEQDDAKNRKGSQSSLLSSSAVYFLDAKRKCHTKIGGNIDNNNSVSHYTHYQFFQQQQQEAAQFSADCGGYGKSTIHLEACGNSPITETFTSENVQMIDSKYKRSVLHWLASNSGGKPEDEIVEEAQMAIDAGADVNARDSDENTPLLLAVKAKRARLCIVLMRAGANPTIFNKSERSCLHEAAVNLDLRMMQILLTDKRMVQEIDELDRNGRTALMEVARLDQDVQIANLLINKGAKIEADGAARKDSEIYKGRTALHYAALCCNLKMVEFLIGMNANKDKQDEAGHTPLMLACKEGHYRMVQYLIECGASLESTDLLDRSALMIAEQQHYHSLVDLIKQALADKEYMETQMRQAQSNKITKGQRATVKNLKRSASRKGYPPAPSSRDSTLHMTPPPSDGSPSPLQYSVYQATLPSHASPSGIYSMQSNTSGSGSTGMVSDASSPEYQPQDSSDMSSCNLSNGGAMWFASSPPYHNPMASSHKISQLQPVNTQLYHPHPNSTSTLVPEPTGIYPDNSLYY